MLHRHRAAECCKFLSDLGALCGQSGSKHLNTCTFSRGQRSCAEGSGLWLVKQNKKYKSENLLFVYLTTMNDEILFQIPPPPLFSPRKNNFDTWWNLKIVHRISFHAYLNGNQCRPTPHTSYSYIAIQFEFQLWFSVLKFTARLTRPLDHDFTILLFFILCSLRAHVYFFINSNHKKY